MDPEFQRVALRVVAIGLGIVAISATLLYFAFRSFGEERKDDSRSVTLVLVTLGFVVVCCIALLALSFK